MDGIVQRIRWFSFVVGVFFLGLGNGSFLDAAEPLPPSLVNVGVSENIRLQVSPDLSFYDSDGQLVQMGSFFDGKRPVILNLTYFGCPMLCSLVLDGLTEALNNTSLKGERFQVVTVSFDPVDTPESAARMKEKYLARLGDKAAGVDWVFLTGKTTDIKRLTDEVGFKYRWVEETKEFAHSAVLAVLTPDGKISRYLYGVDYSAFDFKMAVLEASNRQYVNTVESVLLFCYNYDPQSRGYVLMAQQLMKIGGAVTVVCLVAFLIYAFRRGTLKR